MPAVAWVGLGTARIQRYVNEHAAHANPRRSLRQVRRRIHPRNRLAFLLVACNSSGVGGCINRAVGERMAPNAVDAVDRRPGYERCLG